MSLQCDYNCFSDCSDLAVYVFELSYKVSYFIITHPVLKTMEALATKAAHGVLARWQGLQHGMGSALAG